MLVNVEDRNDNPPRILSLGDQLTIYPDTPLNKPLMRVVAIDDDRGDKVTFDLESGNHDGSFALDSTGVLSLIRPPSSTSYSLVVSATDGGGHTTTQTLPVEVKGDGRNRSDGGGAIFTRPRFDAQVQESLPAGQEVIVLSTSNFQGQDSNIRY